MDRIDCIVAGAGVVGLAVAREMSSRGFETLLVERASAIGTETSARNSEVMHAGLYYPPGSLKADVCVRGHAILSAYVRERAIPHRRCGKLIVATDATQEPGLARIAENARLCGVTSLVKLGAAEAMAMEPALTCTAALFSPETGIIDSQGLMLALLGDAEAAGATLALNSSIIGGSVSPPEIVLQTRDEATGATHEIAARHFINAAGLGANALAASLEGLPVEHVPGLHLAKGNYFSVAGLAPFSHLIYPVPEPGGLGVHLTLDLQGAMRFGPDVEWIPAVEYSVDPCRSDRFYAEIRKYWRGLPDGALQPDYCGIRPKLSGPGEANADFRIDGPQRHGINGLVNLFGIESPGLTSSLAIAAMVADMTAPRRH